MPLPPEIKDRLKKSAESKVSLKTSDGDEVIVEGKTGVPFNLFVKLILKRKIQTLFKDWQDEPVVISSELLTKIASAPEDSTEDRSKIIITAMVIGFCIGMFATAVILVGLSFSGIVVGSRELVAAIGVLGLVALAVFAAMKVQTRKAKQGFVEKIEEIAEVFSR
jgi:hypothetical protein